MKKETGTVIEQCLQKISDIKKSDPLHSITCIVPSNGYIRTIQRAVHQSGEAIAGLTITTMRNFINETTQNELLISGKRYIDSMDIHSIFREILKKGKFKWCGKVKEFSVMPDVLSTSIFELILNSSITNHDKCFSSLGDKGSDLSVIYKEYCTIKKTSSLADYSDIVILCKNLIEKSVKTSGPSFIIFPFVEDDLSYSEKDCINLLSIKSDVTQLNAAEDNTAAVDFFTAPYDTLEISVISERILSLVKQSGAHFENIAVVCPYDYLTLAASEFDAAGIPYFSQYGIPDSKSGGSSLIEALFSFIKSDVNFQDIKKFLLLCPYVSWIEGNSSDDKDHIKISSSGLLNTARKSGAAEGYDNWIHNLTIAIDEENKSDSPKDYVLSHLNTLKTMITDIGEYKEWHKTELDSARHAEIASALINKFIPSGLERNRILAVTDRAGKPAIPVVMTGSDFMEMFLSLISSFSTPAGSAEGSIYLTTKMDDGIFHHVFAPGMTEQRIPKKVRQDPVLSDIDIKKIRGIPGYHLLTAGEKNAIESAKSKRFIGSAYKSWTGSAPSMDILDGKRLYPTPLIMWIYEKSSAAEGVKEFLKHRGFRNFILPVKDEKALNAAEFETARIIFDKTKTSAAHYFASNEAAYGTYKIEKILWSGDEFNDYTGMTGINELKSGLTMSATHAVNLVQCPYKFFLNKCVQLKKIEEPVPAEDVDVMNTGTLVHEILEKFMLIVRDKKPKHDKYESLLKETMDKVLSEFLETNELRYSVIWNKIGRAHV